MTREAWWTAQIGIAAGSGEPAVDAHSHFQRHAVGPGLGRQGPLAGGSGGDGLVCGIERHQERVALGGDLDATLLRPNGAQNPVVLVENVDVTVPEVAE